MQVLEVITALPERSGTQPDATPVPPQQQLNQNSPPHLQEELFARVQTLQGTWFGDSRISVPEARGFFVEDSWPKGPSKAYMIETEFAHLHPAYDGSLHMCLPEDAAAEVVSKGWGELHPEVLSGARPPTLILVYGPRDAEELEVVWTLVQASHAFGTGEYKYGD